MATEIDTDVDIPNAIIAAALLSGRDTRDDPLVSPAVAGNCGRTDRHRRDGYFPDGSGRVTGEIEPLPPTF